MRALKCKYVSFGSCWPRSREWRMEFYYIHHRFVFFFCFTLFFLLFHFISFHLCVPWPNLRHCLLILPAAPHQFEFFVYTTCFCLESLHIVPINPSYFLGSVPPHWKARVYFSYTHRNLFIIPFRRAFIFFTLGFRMGKLVSIKWLTYVRSY